MTALSRSDDLNESGRAAIPTHMRVLILALLLPFAALAASGPEFDGATATMRLISAEDGVAPDAGTISAGLDVDLKPGWKTYWRSPGEVGLPPEIDWSGSENVADVELLFPAPERFEAFDIQNFGYHDRVVFPLRVTLAEPGQPAVLRAEAHLLVCSDICVPETAALHLDLPAGGGVDPDAAAVLAKAVARVPIPAEEAGLRVTGASLDDDALVVSLTADRPLRDPDLFAEAGATAFGRPDISLGGGRNLWARIPVTSRDVDRSGPVRVTLVDSDKLATLNIEPGAEPPVPLRAGGGLIAAMAAALLGGLILNVMPCVLPVLAIKLAGAVQVARESTTRIRAGFLASAAGVLAFVLVLAIGVQVARGAGAAIGWGVQFQSPVFLAAVTVVVALFASSLAGTWEAALPQRWTTAMAQGRAGLTGDFAAGAFAALLATPCSAPFLGTAVAYAFGAGPVASVAVFLMLGLGLALPYLAVAARPSLVACLPRPGRWMLTLKRVMAGLLVVTALWLLWVLGRADGTATAVAVGLLAFAAALAPLLRRRALPAVGIAAALALVTPLVLSAPQARASEREGWAAFNASAIRDHVAKGEVVVVDVTADWCLTCKANKTMVLNRDPVAGRLAAPGVVPMRADWTRPDPAISDFLGRHGRVGIPLNVVYGPGAPDGIALPELLTPTLVMDAMDRASR